jgi:hypothetical protein
MKIDYSSKSYEDLVLDAEIYNQLIEEANQRAKIAEGCDEYAEKRIEAMTISLLSIREEIKKKRKTLRNPLTNH